MMDGMISLQLDSCLRAGIRRLISSATILAAAVLSFTAKGLSQAGYEVHGLSVTCHGTYSIACPLIVSAPPKTRSIRFCQRRRPYGDGTGVSTEAWQSGYDDHVAYYQRTYSRIRFPRHSSFPAENRTSPDIQFLALGQRLVPQWFTVVEHGSKTKITRSARINAGSQCG